MRKQSYPTFQSGDGNAAFYGRVSTEDQPGGGSYLW